MFLLRSVCLDGICENLDAEAKLAFHVRDQRADELIRQLAKARGISLTQAVVEAAEEALAADRTRRDRQFSLRDRLKPLLDRVDALPRTGRKTDKAFFDELWDEGRN
jgi:antitoxin VapB